MSLAYNLDDARHLGLTTSNKRGSSEDTGAAFDLCKLTLSAKLFADLLSKTSSRTTVAMARIKVLDGLPGDAATDWYGEGACTSAAPLHPADLSKQLGVSS
ncbi:hypothetical protein ABIB82_007192 [Bradyrhizobium sp. i1.8.4]|uniref:hypothetical protein n=1 Tax=unclassified Bradyrhizobium TaxID=2631580 RepID=UPI003D1D9575